MQQRVWSLSSICCHLKTPPLFDSGPACIHPLMKQNFDMDDRARLRERFYGVTMTVLARL